VEVKTSNFWKKRYSMTWVYEKKDRREDMNGVGTTSKMDVFYSK
jgi:hypothetical protein